MHVKETAGVQVLTALQVLGSHTVEVVFDRSIFTH